ncbi:uncharacterized protein LOC119659439 [Hermetia illucens]|nr:uncharacterized protein LOC119659439 [Hermetia illucens]
MMRPTPGLGGTLDTKRSKIASQVRSKPSVDIQSSRSKMRPKTASSKRKPVENLEEYCISPEKKVTFEADEIECFFDALKETVEEVVQSKLANMVNSVVDSLTKKIEEVSNKSQKVEATLAAMCGELSNKIMYYGEEHSRHFRYICMKLEYDKIFYQHINNLIHPDPAKTSESGQQTMQQSTPHEPHQITRKLSPPSQHSIAGQQGIDVFATIPTCSHNQNLLSSHEVNTIHQTTGWPHQAGDSALTAQLPPISQTARPFNHSPSGPFQRVMACQTTRSCHKQIEKAKSNPETIPNEMSDPANSLGQSKSLDVAFVSPGSDNKAQLGIKEFLDTLKVFQSNLNNRPSRDKNDPVGVEEVNPVKQASTLSLMDTDDSSSECLVSNGMSILSSEGDSTPLPPD